MKSKKGQDIGDMQKIVITLVVIGMFLGIGLLLLSNFHQQTYERSDTISVVNGSITTVVNTTGSDLPVKNYKEVICDITDCINRTSNTQIPTTNWTDATNCVITAVTPSIYENRLWNCSYSYTYKPETTSTVAVNNTMNATATIPTWIPILIIIIIAAVILFYVRLMRGSTGSM
jgi:hypothetical protein